MIHNLGSKTYIASLLGADSRNASANGTGFDLQGSNDAEGEAIVTTSFANFSLFSSKKNR